MMDEKILLTRKSPEIQAIIGDNFNQSGSYDEPAYTDREDMEDAIEEACRAQLRKGGLALLMNLDVCTEHGEGKPRPTGERDYCWYRWDTSDPDDKHYTVDCRACRADYIEQALRAATEEVRG